MDSRPPARREPVAQRAVAATAVDADPGRRGHDLSRFAIEDTDPPPPLQRQSQAAGLPAALRQQMEDRSGIPLDGVAVHYDSPRPAQLGALAFAQGQDIHLAPGQERHLPHEAWHVVQQAQGRVALTTSVAGVAVNDDPALEREAEQALQSAPQPPIAQRASPARAAPVAQAVRSLLTFQGQTPKGLITPRDTVQAVDTALDNYISASGANKLAMGQALVAATTLYLNTPGRDATRRGVVQGLQQEVQAELPLVTALGAHADLTDDLLQRTGGAASLVALTALATTITANHADQLPALVRLAGGAAGLATLDTLVQHILPQNAYLLPGLIPLAGGAAQLAALDTLVTHATPANALLLVRLIPMANNLAELDALVQAAGAAHVPLLPEMITDAGGAGAVVALTGAITMNHAGNGAAAQALTARGAAGGGLARFLVLTGILPNFLRDPNPPNVTPANVIAEIQAYNSVVAPAPNPIPYNNRIWQVNYVHFFQRHTMRYFDFANISPRNDQWPFLAGAVNNALEAVLTAALHAINPGAAPGWVIIPNVVYPAVVAGGFTSQLGTIRDNGAGNAPPSNPAFYPGGAVALAARGPGVPGVALGQFYPLPAGGGGVIPLDRADMQAIDQVV